MEIKKVLKDSDFLDMIESIKKMTIDIFEDKTQEKAYGIKFSKKIISYDKVINGDNLYDDCYTYYKESVKKLNDLYLKHSSEFLSLYDFVVALFENLKNYVVLTSVLPSKNILPPRNLSTTEEMYYDQKKEEYKKLILSRPQQSVNLLASIKVFENSDRQNIIDFIDQTEMFIDSFMTENGLDVSDKKLKQNLLFEYLSLYLENSYLSGDNLTTKKININTTRFDGKDLNYKNTPDLLKGLAFLENYILAENAGLLSKNIAFDGFRFFDTKTGKTQNASTLNLHQTKLSGADIYAQSNFVLNEDFAKSLLMFPKRFVKTKGVSHIKIKEIVDGDKIETYKTMYRKKFKTHNAKADFMFNSNIEIGNFCKVKQFNRTQGTYSYMLFYFPDNDGKQAIQLFRIDKVADSFKGAPASHNLRGKEKIQTTLHAHSYNLIDAVLKNYTREDNLGKMDISHIFPTTDGLDSKIIEEFFDCFCGIHGKHLKKVNQKKFAKLFKKYGMQQENQK